MTVVWIMSSPVGGQKRLLRMRTTEAVDNVLPMHARSTIVRTHGILGGKNGQDYSGDQREDS